MKCQKCQKMAVLNAFDDGSCLNCGEEISTAYMPCDKVCESCSEKHKICQSCGETMDLKKIFDTLELRPLSSYILDPKIKPLMPKSELKQIQEYAIFLKTKLTPELVEKLFKRVEKQPRNTMTKYILGVDGFVDGDGFILGFDGKEWFTNSCSHIETLADLARLTAAKPILLA